MNNRRKLIVALGSGALLAPFCSFAQQQGKVWRIGFLGPGSASNTATRVEALRAGLRDLGYVEGKNILIEFRWAENKIDRLPELAAELVRLKVDLLVTVATTGTRALKQATTTIPIVMALSGDAVAMGLIANLARPGGNITGSTFFDPELMAKRIELIKETLPRMANVAVLVNSDNPMTGPLLQVAGLAAGALKIGLQQFEARGPKEFEGAFAAMEKKRVDAVVISNDATFITNAKAIADLATKHRLPSIGFSELAEAGSLMGYAPNFLELWHRAAYFVDKILKGTKPADIPVEQPTKFELVINMKTAKALGIKIPPSIMVRADKVIE
jgi:putative ABC transport system substrate-binding protein